MRRRRRLPIWRTKLRFRVKKRRRGRNSYSHLLIMCVLILLSIYIFTVFNMKVRPTVISIAEAKAKNIAIQAINEAVNEKISDSNIQYQDLVNLEKNNNGEITALQANIVKMNQIKSALSISIQQKVTEINTAQVNVPIGNVINSDMLAGWGPRIPVRLIPVSSVQLDFKNDFASAGINQTKHEILLQVQVSVGVLLPTIQKNTDVTTTVPVAQTVIVGNVPQSYTNVDGTTGTTPNKVLNLLP